MVKHETKTHSGEDNTSEAQRKRKAAEPVLEDVNEYGVGPDFPPVIAGDFTGVPSIERHAALLGDDRFSHPANMGQKARIMMELQHNYGNAYVQRVVERIQAKPVANTGDAYQADPGRGEGLATSELTDVVPPQAVPTLQRQKPGTEATEKTERPPTPYDALQNFVEDSKDAWYDNQERFNDGMRQFERTMTMESEQDAVPDYTGAIINHVVEYVTKKALDKLTTLIPGFDEVKGLLDALTAEQKRAEKAAEEVSLKQFLQKIDRAMRKSFEKQRDAVRKGRDKLWSDMKRLDEKTQWDMANSFPGWLKEIRNAIPKAAEYEAALHVAWINSYRGTIKDWKPQGVIEIKFNAETPGKYIFESAKVLSPFPKRSASGLNRALSTPESGMKNILDIPIYKIVGLYAENLVGGTSYGWAHMDEKNNTTQVPVLPVPKQRWKEMPWEPLEKITRVSG
jgi:hypothetical protein